MSGAERLIAPLRSRVTSPRARYLLVGATCAAANNLLMIGGDLLGAHYFPLTLLCFVLVTPFAFWLHVRFTFGEEATWPRFVRFTSGVAAAYPLSLLATALLCGVLRVPMVVAAPAVTIILFAWHYASAHLAILGRLRRAGG